MSCRAQRFPGAEDLGRAVWGAVGRWWPGCRHPVSVWTVLGGVLGHGHQGGSIWSQAGSACGQEVVNQGQMTWALGGGTKNFILRDQERDRAGQGVCVTRCVLERAESRLEGKEGTRAEAVTGRRPFKVRVAGFGVRENRL